MLLIIDMLSSASNPFKPVKIITLQMLCQGRKTAEIVSINPQTPGRNYPAPLFQQSRRKWRRMRRTYAGNFPILLIALLDRGLCPCLDA